MRSRLPHISSRPFALPLVVLSAFGVLSCGGGDSPSSPGGGSGPSGSSGPPAALAALTTNQQAGAAGEAVPVAPSVQVLDAQGRGVPGVSVTFSVLSGGGLVTGGSQVTNASGTATVGSWTLGSAAGANSLRAIVAGLAPVLFEAVGAPGPASRLDKVEGDGQSAQVGATLAVDPRVRVTDQHGNPIQGVEVTFAVTGGDGAITGGTVSSDENGSATVGSWTLGPDPGPNSLEASAPGLASVVFGATATPAPPEATTLEKVAGDNQSVEAGTPVPVAPQVRVRDQYGDPMEGVQVSFAITAGAGATISGALQTTDSDGLAAVGSWTLAPSAGPNALRASVTGLPHVTFDATGTPTPPVATTLEKVAGDGQSAAVSSMVAVPPQIRVRDQYGDPMSGVQVDFAVSGGGGSISGVTQTTDGDGLAAVGSWTLGPSPGANSLQASSAGLFPVSFSATATSAPGVPASVEVARGHGQVLGTGAEAVVRPTVRVLDGASNPVSGVTVDFAVTLGGGSVTGSSGVTNPDGLATVGSWTMGPVPGMNRVSATVSGLPAATFDATTVTAGGYDIDLVFLTTPTASQQAVFDAAEAIWESIIEGDQADVSFAGSPIAANDCGITHPGFSGTVDDLMIWVRIEAIDGPGGILGQAGPCFIRNSNSLPIVGVMRFDDADIAALEASGQLDRTILHEIGHVLGAGAFLWGLKGFLQNPSVGLPPNTVDTHFSGTSARGAFDELGGDDYAGGAKVPVENAFGGSGSRDSHWRESVFDTELMTPVLDGGVANPLTIVSIAGLMDLGYAVDGAPAEAYIVPGPLASLTFDGEPLTLGNDLLRVPLRLVDGDGRVRRVIEPGGGENH